MGRRGELGADAFGRWVGISLLAFCADCGQPRKLLRSSSGAKSRGVSHVPASRPSRASGSAATPPTAPRPMMTTSVFLRSMAMAATFHREHWIVVSGLPDQLCAHAHALLVLGDRQTDAGVADQIPADEIRVAAV